MKSMKKIFLFNCIVLLTAITLAQAPTTITAGMTGAQVRTALNANFGITDTASFNMLQYRKSTASNVGVIFKGKIPWMHDYPGTNIGGGTTAAQISSTRGKNLFIGKWSGATFPTLPDDDNGTMNTGIGDSTLASITLSEANTAIGDGALAATTASSLNTAVGRQAMYRFKTGHSNTSIGESSLERLNVGSPVGNTALGTNAGMFLVDGSYNTLIGYNAGYGASTPDYVTGIANFTNVTGIGHGVFSKMKTGVNNIAIGPSAMGETVTSGINNIAIGIQALNYNHKNYNIAIGDYAGETDSLGYFNTYIGSQVARSSMDAKRNFIGGYNAGYSLTSGSENTFAGALAGNLVTTGNENTIIGRSAGNALTTGSENVFLGYAAGYYETGSGKLFIDVLPRASEADARIKALVYGVFAAAPVDQRFTLNAVLTLTPMADPPGAPAEGMIYADTDHHLYYYNGSGWVQLDN